MSDVAVKDDAASAPATEAVPEIQLDKMEKSATDETVDTADIKAENIADPEVKNETSSSDVNTKSDKAAPAPSEVKQEMTGADVKTESDETLEIPDEVKQETAGTVGGSEDTQDKKAKHKPNSTNVKSNPSVLPETDDPKEILKQAEHYFSDDNLPQDEFLWSLTGGDENKPVWLRTICNFGRMRRFPFTAVVAALRESTELEVEGEEGKETVKRKQPYVKTGPEGAKQDIPRSIYARGFGEEGPSTQYDIESFFNKFGVVKKIKLRRDEQKAFKKSVFVKFASEEEASKLANLKPPPTFEGKELEIMKKQDYMDEKNALHNIKPKEPKATFWEGENGSGRFNGGPGGRGGRGGRGRGNRATNPDDWNKRREEDQKNGFKDSRNRNGRGGRGGRGHGRGGRGGRDRHDQRKNEPKPATVKSTNDVTIPEIKTSASPTTKKNDGDKEAKGEKKTDGKRARGEDGDPTEEPPTKKVDTKETVAAAA